MKIGIFDPYLDTLGGGEKYMLTAASCLSSANEVDIFWNTDEGLIKKAQDRFGIDLSKVKLAKNIFSKDTSLLSRLLVSRKYDLVIFLSDGSIPLMLAKKLVLHFQFPVEWVDRNSFVTKIKIRRVDKIICNSKFTKIFIDRTFRVGSTVLYPPADVGIINFESRIKRENVILTVGRFGRLPEGNNFKKHDVMIKCFKQMVDSGFSGWEFIVVISYKDQDIDEVEKLKALAKGYPVRIIGNMTARELSKFYEKAKIYWHAAGFGEDLKKHPELAEHFGISTVEAMGAGAVPVAINAGGQKEIVQNGKNGFLWDTTNELIEKTNILVRNNKLWEKMSNEATIRAKIFSKERFCKELDTILL